MLPYRHQTDKFKITPQHSNLYLVNGELKKGSKMTVMSSQRSHIADRVGCFTPKMIDRDILKTGEVGFVIAGIKDIDGAPVGDTLTLTANPCNEALPDFKQVQPRVFAGLFPISSDDFESFREALKKLRLNDASLYFEPESSTALGLGFRCGFLGMLHLEIIQERLEREYNLELITTAPTVIFEILNNKNEVIFVDNPAKLPPPNEITELREPIILASILVPQEHVGSVIKLCIEKRGRQRQIRYLGKQVSLEYEMPLAEVVMDFFDRLKSVSRGYASYDYQFLRFQAAPLIRLDILINGERVDALAVIIHRDNSIFRGREIVEKMRKLIPRQMFDVPIQVALGGKLLRVKRLKLYAKMLLLNVMVVILVEKENYLKNKKLVKRRMKQIGSVEIPQEAFLTILSVDGKKGKN